MLVLSERGLTLTFIFKSSNLQIFKSTNSEVYSAISAPISHQALLTNYITDYL